MSALVARALANPSWEGFREARLDLRVERLAKLTRALDAAEADDLLALVRQVRAAPQFATLKPFGLRWDVLGREILAWALGDEGQQPVRRATIKSARQAGLNPRHHLVSSSASIDRAAWMCAIHWPGVPDDVLFDLASEAELQKWRATSPPGRASTWERGQNALMAALEAGRPSLARRLAPLFDPRERDETGLCALAMAAGSGDVEAIEALLPYGGADARDSHGMTPWLRAAWHGQAPALMALEPHSDIAATDLDNRDALALAVFSGDAACVRWLLRAENDIPRARAAAEDSAVDIEKQVQEFGFATPRLLRARASNQAIRDLLDLSEQMGLLAPAAENGAAKSAKAARRL
jgi:hypothetical protein